MKLGWNLFRALRSKAWTWSGAQTFVSAILSGPLVLTGSGRA